VIALLAALLLMLVAVAAWPRPSMRASWGIGGPKLPALDPSLTAARRNQGTAFEPSAAPQNRTP
jgi:hypothetical protein